MDTYSYTPSLKAIANQRIFGRGCRPTPIVSSTTRYTMIGVDSVRDMEVGYYVVGIKTVYVVKQPYGDVYYAKMWDALVHFSKDFSIKEVSDM